MNTETNKKLKVIGIDPAVGHGESYYSIACGRRFLGHFKTLEEVKAFYIGYNLIKGVSDVVHIPTSNKTIQQLR